MYNLLDKMKPEDLRKIKENAQHIIEHQDEY